MKCSYISPPPPKDLKLSSTQGCNEGFTLVELSIVLLVIGLLVSGVLVGKDMIRAAELRSITTQKDQLQTSVMLFQDKYHGLPGDLKNAIAFWGEMGAINGGTGVCSNTAAGASGATGTQTCNGNGSGTINDTWTAVIGSNAETFLFWQHLSNAGLVEGKYSGIYGTSNQEMLAKIKNVTWGTFFLGVRGITDTNYFEADNGNILQLGVDVLSPTEAWGIDKKIDDGLPGLGSMVIFEGSGANCNSFPASATMPASSFIYNLDYESAACLPIFKNIW